MLGSLPHLRRVALLVVVFLSTALWAQDQGLGYAAEYKEYLVNGGFESATDGTPVNWSPYNATVTQVDSPKRSGGYAGALSPASGGSITVWAYQTVADIVPGTYRLSGYIRKNDPRVSSVLLRIRWQAEDGSQIGVNDSSQLTADSPDFQFLATSEVSAPANARSVSVRILLANNSPEKGVVYLDDLSLQGPVPSPPTATHTPTSTLPATPSLTATFTHTWTPTVTQSPTRTPSATASPTSTKTSTRTPTPRPTATPSKTPTPTSTPAPVTQANPGEVLIHEFQYDPPQSGVDGAYEWVELYNRSDHPIALQGWGLRDNQERDVIPPLTLSPGGFAIVAASSHFTVNFPDFGGTIVFIEDGTIGNGLSNQGDRLVLEDGAGRIIDQVSYGSDATVLSPALALIAAGSSYERRSPGLDSDTASDFWGNPDPSPGLAAVPQNTPTATAASDPTPTRTLPPQPTRTLPATVTALEKVGSAQSTGTFTPTAILVSEVMGISVEASPVLDGSMGSIHMVSTMALDPVELRALLVGALLVGALLVVAIIVVVAGWQSK